MLKPSTIPTLAANPPRQLTTWRTAMAEIHGLEIELGLEPSANIVHLSNARARISELHAMKARLASVPSNASPAPTHSAAAKPCAQLSTSQLLSLSTAVNPGHGFWHLDGEAKQRAAAAQWFYCRHLTYPGCESDFAALDNEAARRQPLASFDGLAKSSRAFSQQRISTELKKLLPTK